MGKHGKFGRREDRAARRAAKKELARASDDERYKRPPVDQWTAPDVFSFPLSPTSRLFVRTNHYRGKCIDFAICHQVGGPYRWTDLFRIDCNHDTVHSHDFSHGEEVKSVITPITEPTTVDAQYTEQYRFMLESWEQREREWHDD